MSERRRYEVSFRTDLDDREVANLAHELAQLGFDPIYFAPDPPRRRYPVSDRDALRAADQHDLQRALKW